MANPLLGKLQGQGLIETTTAGLEQAGAQLAVTPVGAAMQGRGLDSQKMAGTKPAKVNAVAAARGLSPTNMRDVTSAALGKLREAGRMMEGQEAEIAQTARQASVLGRVDDQIARLAQSKTLERLRGLQFTGAELNTDQLTGYTEEQTAELKASIGDLIAGGKDLTDSDVDTINAALEAVGQDPLSFKPGEKISLPLMAQRLSTLFKDVDAETLEQNISQAILDAKAESTIGSLDDQAIQAIFQTDDVSETQADLLNLLSSITGKSTEELGKMQLGDLRSAIDSWKQTEFKNVGDLRKTFNDPNASKAERQLAHKELRRLGYVGVTAAEAKIGDLQKQMEEGDTVTIGNETFTVEELFSDPEKLLQIQTWVDNPETAPPEVKTWLEQNKDAINLKMGELTGAGATGLTGMYQRIKENQENFALDPSVANLVGKDTMETFFPDYADIGLDATIPKEEDTQAMQTFNAEKAKIDADTTLTPEQKAAKIAELEKTRDAALEKEMGNYRKYQFLQSPETAKSAMLLMNNLQTIAGIDGKEIFNNLTSAQMAQIFARGEYGVNDFIQGLKDRQRVSQFKGDTNFKTEFSDLARDLGLGSTAGQLANLMDVNLAPYKDILSAAGLKLDKSGKLDTTQLRTMLDGLKSSDLQGLIGGSARNMKDALSKLAVKLNNEIGKGPKLQTELASDKEREEAFRKANPGIRTYEETLGQLGSENHINYTEQDRLYKEYRDRGNRPAEPDRQYYDSDSGFNKAAYERAVQRHAERLAEWNAKRDNYVAAYKKWKDSESRFWDWKNSEAQRKQEYQDKRSDWYNNTYLVDMRKNNEAKQKVYSDLADLFGGIS